jgi:uncharacterized protein (DUF2062 family)/trans-aconitate methyltransferase
MKANRSLRELLYRLRTEGGSPARLAAAVGVGVFIGCSPFWGFHILICLAVARLLGLNRILTALASHISFPGFSLILIGAEVQIARRLRGVPLLSVHSFHTEDLWRLAWWKHFGGDLMVGSLVIGPLLAVAAAWPTYRIALRRSREPERNALIEEAAYRYLGTGMWHWEVVRGKLRYDPGYLSLLRGGALPCAGRLLDLGCGRGILFSLLLAARAQAARGVYPAAWTPPPLHLSFTGIEWNAKTADVAREALGAEAHIEVGDLGDLDVAAFPAADAVVLLDVLHYLPAAAQETLLARATSALAPGGLLLLRDADADGGWRFTATRIQERLAALTRRHWRQRFHYRSRAEWRRLLETQGLEVTDAPMAEGTPYANVLITGRKA